MRKSSSVSSEMNDFNEEDGKKIYNVSKSRLVSLISWVQVIRIYLPAVWFLILGIMIGQVFQSLYEHRFDLQTFYNKEITVISLEKGFALDLGWKTMGLLTLLVWYINYREKSVYLVDFTTFEPPENWKVSPAQLIEIMRAQNCFTEESIDFMDRMSCSLKSNCFEVELLSHCKIVRQLLQSGVGPSTAWPPGIIKCLNGEKADRSAEGARKESEVVMFDCVRRILEQTKTKAKHVDFLVVNCSLFSPTPSLCTMIINEFQMRSDVSSYNLSGMGCSASLISIELVKNLLNSKRNSIALVVSTENLTQNLYHGNERGFLLQNTLFRCGGAAMLLSNRWTDAYRSAFKLLNVVRTQYVSEDSYGCVYETEDANNERGVRLSKDIVKVAGRAMEKNFTTLGPYVLPISEQAKTGFWMAVRYIAKQAKSSLGVDFGKINPYIPDFKRGVDHFCIHAGGRGVIDGIEKNLNLTPRHVAASRHALFTYGNTSSSSIWYELDFIRTSMDLRSGNRVLQVAFGSGFKCNSAVWLCLKGGCNKNLKSKSS